MENKGDKQMRINNDVIVYNPRVKAFQYIKFEKGRFKTVKYEKGKYIGMDESGNEIYKAFNYIIHYNPSEKQIVKIKKQLGISLTFSVETEGGHEPIYIEITVYTQAPKEKEEEIEKEIHDTIHKILYIMYDLNKDIGKRSILYPTVNKIKYKVIAMIRDKKLDMKYINEFLDRISSISWLRLKQEYISEKISKEGIEYISFKAPDYPEIQVEIEQRRPRPYSFKFKTKIEKEKEEEK